MPRSSSLSPLSITAQAQPPRRPLRQQQVCHHHHIPRQQFPLVHAASAIPFSCHFRRVCAVYCTSRSSIIAGRLHSPGPAHYHSASAFAAQVRANNYFRYRSFIIYIQAISAGIRQQQRAAAGSAPATASARDRRLQAWIRHRPAAGHRAGHGLRPVGSGTGSGIRARPYQAPGFPGSNNQFRFDIICRRRQIHIAFRDLGRAWGRASGASGRRAWASGPGRAGRAAGRSRHGRPGHHGIHRLPPGRVSARHRHPRWASPGRRRARGHLPLPHSHRAGLGAGNFGQHIRHRRAPGLGTGRRRSGARASPLASARHRHRHQPATPGPGIGTSAWASSGSRRQPAPASRHRAPGPPAASAGVSPPQALCARPPPVRPFATAIIRCATIICQAKCVCRFYRQAFTGQ